jgi:diguanylate cyclase
MTDSHSIVRTTGSADKASAAESSFEPELLKRALVRVSIAADGLDPLLDKRLKELRNALRSDAPPHLLTELMPDLERAVLAADNAREERLRQIGTSLRMLVRQLQQRNLPSGINATLKQLARRIDTPIEYTSSIQTLIADIVSAQADVLKAPATDGSGGFLARLFKPASASAEKTPELLEPAITDGLSEPEAPAADIVGHDALIPDIEWAREQTEDDEQCAEGASVVGNLSGEEKNYSQAAAHIETILINVLTQLQILDKQRLQADQLRERISRGLNWYELAAALDDLSALVLGAQQSRQQDFELYLQQLNSRLAQFHGNLEQAHVAYTGSLEAGKALEGTIRDQVKGLHSDVSNATNLEALKANVETKLNALLVNVEESRCLHTDREEQVAGQLKSMTDRIQIMEVEATTFRNHLEEQRERALIDTLTGLPNRAGLEKRMEEEYERWQRYGGELLLVVLDVDHFKRVNDQFGHLSGDKVLRLIAQQLSRRLRKSDFIGRFGGEEFVILMPGTTVEKAATVLEELRAGIENSPFHFKNERVTITISIGYTDFCLDDTLEQVFERADQAMYRAKNDGRNQVMRAD